MLRLTFSGLLASERPTVGLYRCHSGLFVGPFIASAMYCLNSVECWVNKSELVSDSADITIDGISFYQTLPCDIIQCFISLDVTGATSQ